MDVVFHAQTWPFPAAARHWPGLVRSGSQLRSQWIIMLKTGYFGPLDVSILVVVSILDTGCMLGIWLSLNKSKFPTNNGGLMGTSMNGVVFHCYVWLLGSRCSEWKDWEVAGRYSLHRLTELQLLLLAHGLDWKWCSPIQLVSSSPSCSYWDCLLGDIPHCQIHVAPASEVRNHHRSCQGAQISNHLTSGVTSCDPPR